MKVVNPSIEVFFWKPDCDNINTIEEAIELFSRTCYKSEDKITEDSANAFVRSLRKRGHHAMLEFGYAVVKIIADRGLTHELVRHRLASFAQESTRFCNYSKDKFDHEISVIRPPGLTDAQFRIWYEAMKNSQDYYMTLINLGCKPEIARSVLPIGIKTEIVIGANTREWRHIFELRCATKAHPTIRGVMLDILKIFNNKMPSIYEDIFEKYLS